MVDAKGDIGMKEKIVKYIKEKYNIEPQRPWAKYPENLTFKAGENDKWFALIMPVEKRKLGMDSEGEIFIINVKARADFIAMMAGIDGYMPAYHMNKNHWLTVFLDGTVPISQVMDRVDESYEMITDSPSKRIYEAVKKIPRGRVATYGQVAELAGDKRMARAVGNALHKNPDPDNIPCFRIVNAKGELAGEFAFGGKGAQAELLEDDGVEVVDGKVDLKKYGICVEEINK